MKSSCFEHQILYAGRVCVRKALRTHGKDWNRNVSVWFVAYNSTEFPRKVRKLPGSALSATLLYMYASSTPSHDNQATATRTRSACGVPLNRRTNRTNERTNPDGPVAHVHTHTHNHRRQCAGRADVLVGSQRAGTLACTRVYVKWAA